MNRAFVGVVAMIIFYCMYHIGRTLNKPLCELTTAAQAPEPPS